MKGRHDLSSKHETVSDLYYIDSANNQNFTSKVFAVYRREVPKGSFVTEKQVNLAAKNSQQCVEASTLRD